MKNYFKAYSDVTPLKPSNYLVTFAVKSELMIQPLPVTAKASF
jgi:hypothetical protein